MTDGKREQENLLYAIKQLRDDAINGKEHIISNPLVMPPSIYKAWMEYIAPRKKRVAKGKS